MELSKIVIHDKLDTQVIWLREVDGARRFPISIGPKEAEAIHHRLNGSPSPRPLTHDLLGSVIEHLGGVLERIEIVDLQDHTFFARLCVRQNGKLVEIDSRPSDAIALGIGANCPIFVEEHVIEAAS